MLRRFVRLDRIRVVNVLLDPSMICDVLFKVIVCGNLLKAQRTTAPARSEQAP